MSEDVRVAYSPAKKYFYGGLAERLKAAVLKTVDVMSVLGFESLSLRHLEPMLISLKNILKVKNS